MKTKNTQKLTTGACVVMMQNCFHENPQLQNANFAIGDIGKVTDVLDDGRFCVDLGPGHCGHTFPKTEPDLFLSPIPAELRDKMILLEKKGSLCGKLADSLAAYVSDDFQMGGRTKRAERHNARLQPAEAILEKLKS